MIDALRIAESKSSVSSSSLGSGLSLFSSDGGSSTPLFENIWFLIFCVVISLVIAAAVFFVIVKSSRTPRGRFLNWLKEYLNFRSILIENILKFLYLFFAVYITIYSFGFISESVLSFFGILILGNIGLRLLFEFGLMFIIMWKNTSDISVSSRDIRDYLVSKREKTVESRPAASRPVVEKEVVYEKKVEDDLPQIHRD